MPQPPDTVWAIRPLTKAAVESLTEAFDLTALLASGETLTGTPTITATPAGLTIGTPAVNTTALTDSDGNTIAIGKAIEVTISGGSAGRYELTVSCGTSAGGGRTRGGKVLLLVDV